MTMLLFWNNRRRALPRLLQNLRLLQAKSPGTRATRTNGRGKGAKRGRTADSGALVSTPQPLPGRLRGTPNEKHPGAQGPENVTAARPPAAQPGLVAETETRTGTVRETILEGNTVVKGGGADPGVGLGPGHGLGHDPEQGPTDEGPAQNGHLPESSLLRGESAGEDGGLGKAVGLVVTDGGAMGALGALKMVSLQRVPPIARAGQKILTGLQKRVVRPMAGAGTSVAVHAGKTNATVVGTEESHGAGENVEGLTVAGARDGAVVIVASTTSRRTRPTTAGSPETTSQVQATIQGMTPTVASTKTEVGAAEKRRSQETLCLIGLAGLRHPAGLLGGHYLQMFRIITPRGREEGLEAGTDKRRSSQQQQQVKTLLNCMQQL